MILFNNEIFISTEEQLNDFCSLLYAEIFNNDSKIGITVLIDYLHDCFIADKKLTDLINRRIGTDVVPIVFIEFSEYANLTELNFGILSTEENRDISMREELLFQESCDICFKNIKCLFDRLHIATENQ